MKGKPKNTTHTNTEGHPVHIKFMNITSCKEMQLCEVALTDTHCCRKSLKLAFKIKGLPPQNVCTGLRWAIKDHLHLNYKHILYGLWNKTLTFKKKKRAEIVFHVTYLSFHAAYNLNQQVRPVCGLKGKGRKVCKSTHSAADHMIITKR